MKSLILTFFFSLCTLLHSRPIYVTAELMGQLGNQMFQIAATLNIAYETGAIASFPDLVESKLFNIPSNYKNMFSHLNTAKIKGPFILHKEFTYHYTPIPEAKRNLKLFGYFNSEKYFEKHKDKIVKVFQPSNEIRSYLKNKYPSILKHPKTVAIHLRTYNTDLEENPNVHKYHPFVGWYYVKKAMTYFDDSYLFLVFSDDIPFVKQEMTTRGIVGKNVKFVEGNTAHQDLYFMSFCKHNIISNSTFSWWAAYLNRNPNKKVIAPKRWLGELYDGVKDTKDVIPNGWITINN